MIGRLDAGFAGALQAAIQRATHVSHLHFRETTGSTNEDALLLARSGAPHGTLVVADAQRSGRGRQGRTWHSPAGHGLWFSWILRPDLTHDRAFWVSAAAAVAVADTVGRIAGVRAVLRWPNDVLARGRKVAGLLAEAGGSGGRLDFIVLGIGLNVNQLEADFPPGLRGEAVSLKMLSGHEHDRAGVFAIFVEAFEFLYRTIEIDRGESVRREWLALCPMIGRLVSVAGPGLDFNGTAAGLADDGALIVDRDDGTRSEVRAADVRLLRELE